MAGFVLNQCTPGGTPSLPVPCHRGVPHPGLLRGSCFGGHEPELSTRSLVSSELQDSGAPLRESCLCSTSFPLLPSQLGTRRRAESQISNENCQEISPLQKKQGKTTSWWGFSRGRKSEIVSFCLLCVGLKWQFCRGKTYFF